MRVCMCVSGYHGSSDIYIFTFPYPRCDTRLILSEVVAVIKLFSKLSLVAAQGQGYGTPNEN